MKLKTFKPFNPRFSFILNNRLRRVIENMDGNIKIMGIKAGMRVLEAGCGNGFVTPFLSSAVSENGFVVSVDFQEKMVEKAKKKNYLLKNVDFRTESASDLKTINAGEMDAVFLYYSFHEIQDKEKAVSEFYRVLKPDGLLTIKEPRVEVLSRDRIQYKDFIAGNGFKYIGNADDNCDFLGCYLKFTKQEAVA